MIFNIDILEAYKQTGVRLYMAMSCDYSNGCGMYIVDADHSKGMCLKLRRGGGYRWKF